MFNFPIRDGQATSGLTATIEQLMSGVVSLSETKKSSRRKT
jgi:hypothetical protein